jgi:phage gpG-like protein
MKVSVTIHDENLSGIEKRLANMQHFYEGTGELLVDSMVRNFDEQGRPQKWKPLAAATVLGGAGYGGQRMTKRGTVTKGFERHLQGKQILITRGMLRNSIKKEATSAHVVVGSNLKYAALQNFGGDAGRGHKVFVPARPFVVVQDEDRVEMNIMLRRWVMVGQ